MSDEIKTYQTLEELEAALDRGETARLEMEPFKIDPWLVQKALDLQSAERLAEWKRQQQQTED